MSAIAKTPETTVTLGDLLDAETLRLSAQMGFTYAQKALNKTNITPGDALVLFNNYEGNDSSIIIQLFSLAVTMLDSSRESLESIGEDIHDKLQTQCVNILNEKLDKVDFNDTEKN